MGTINITQDDAFHIIVRGFRENLMSRSGYSNYGYELYLPNLIRVYLNEEHGIEVHSAESHIRKLSPQFYDAAWEMCRRGIIRPSITNYQEQATADGASGNGYSLTAFGRIWIEQSGQYDYVPTEPGRFAKLLDKYSPKYGPVFQERSQEAIKCYGYTAYLASCAMCGAAAESIILSLAIAKTNDESKIIKEFSSAGGRRKVENLIIGQKPRHVQDEFLGYSSLLKYWRDISAHGRLSGISDSEAYTSLALLLRFAQFANDNWDDLIK